MNRQILRLAIPNIISNISVPLLSAVDTMLMGHISTLHLSALGVGAMIFVFLYGNFNFLRMGTTGITAQVFGANDKNLITNTLFRAILLALLISFVIIFFKEDIFKVSIYLMNVDDSYLQFVSDYFDIRIWAVPAVLLSFVLFGWFFGVQDATTPLYITIFVNIINIILSYYLVNVLNMGIKGAAYGTVVAQYCGLILTFVFLQKYHNLFTKFSTIELLDHKMFAKFLNINKDIFIRTVALTFVLAFFYSQSAKYSSQTLSKMVLLLQFLIWFSFAVDGFANATESLVGKYYGLKDWDNFDKAVRYNFYFSFGFALLFSVVYYFGGEAILHLYTSDLGLVEGSIKYIWLVAMLPIVSFAAFIYDGIFIGMTASKSMRNMIVLSMILFLGGFYATKDIDYEWALWGNFVLFFLFRSVIGYLMFKRYGKRLK